MNNVKQQSFKLSEAVDLLNKPVVATKSYREKVLNGEFQGKVVGVLTVNSEIEVVVSFFSTLTQMNRTEFDCNILEVD